LLPILNKIHLLTIVLTALPCISFAKSDVVVFGNGGRRSLAIRPPSRIAEFAHNADHDHMVIRDPSNNYGEDWPGKRYEEHHPYMEDAIWKAADL